MIALTHSKIRGFYFQQWCGVLDTSFSAHPWNQAPVSKTIAIHASGKKTQLALFRPDRYLHRRFTVSIYQPRASM
jgi:hypothetical protein